MGYMGRVLSFISGVAILLTHLIRDEITIIHNLIMGSVIIIILWLGLKYDQKKTCSSEKKALINIKKKYQELIESVVVGIFIYKKDKFIFTNNRFRGIIGYNTEELNNLEIFELVLPEDREVLRTDLVKLKKGDIGQISHQIRIVNKHGNIVYIEVHVNLTKYEESLALTGTIMDITEQKKSEKRINQMAYFDALTGLPNRYRLNEYLEYCIIHSEQEKGKTAIMFIDLDRFKLVNDTLGHKVGDLLLQKVAERLKKCIRQQDKIARYGGDEFVVILEETDKAKVAKVAERMLVEFKAPFILNDNEIHISPSIGISIYPDHGKEIETLIRKADKAMYQAKKDGKNTYHFCR